MTRVRLRIYRKPGRAEVFLHISRTDGGIIRLVALVDTGAEVTLLPQWILDFVPHAISGKGLFEVQQAGIARQVFSATEATIKIALEDEFGNRIPEFSATAWFADTEKALVGFQDGLDRAVLHLDMPALTGYLEFPD